MRHINDAFIVDLGGLKDEACEAIASVTNENLISIINLVDSRKPELTALTEQFAGVNDVPTGSSILKEITKEGNRVKFVQDGDLPFIFGILSRYDDYFNGSTITLTNNWMLEFLTGCHNYVANTTYTGFYSAPKLCFFQGSQGNFIKRKHYTKYTYTTSQYQYPYAAVGCLFVKNTTGLDITSALTLGGTGYDSTNNLRLFVGVPNTATETITWTTAYSHTSSTPGVYTTSSITVPANSTVVVMFCTASYYIAAPTDSSSVSYKYHAQFLYWRLNKVRTDFLKEGLEIDFDKTLKAWQCPGFASPFELFKPTTSI